MSDAREWGPALNEAAWEFLERWRSVTGEPVPSGAFNDIKSLLRDAILVYEAEIERRAMAPPAVQKEIAEREQFLAQFAKAREQIAELPQWAQNQMRMSTAALPEVVRRNAYTTRRNAWTGSGLHTCNACHRQFSSEHGAAYHYCEKWKAER